MPEYADLRAPSRRAVLAAGASAAAFASPVAAAGSPDIHRRIADCAAAVARWRSAYADYVRIREPLERAGALYPRIVIGESQDLSSGKRRPRYVDAHWEIDEEIDSRLAMFGNDAALLAGNAKTVTALEARRARLHAQLRDAEAEIAARDAANGLAAAARIEEQTGEELDSALIALLDCKVASLADARALARLAVEYDADIAPETRKAMLAMIVGVNAAQIA